MEGSLEAGKKKHQTPLEAAVKTYSVHEALNSDVAHH